MLKKIKPLLTPFNILVFGILVLAFILRVYRIDVLLGFYYDQGRDAIVIWDLLHKGKLFLIGPTTGIAGIFRGPFYYYLITPFYFLGNGNPLFPEIFLIVTSVLALGLMFLFAKKIGGNLAGLISIILATFSYEMIFASRWLSNPTPMLLISMIVLACVYMIYEGLPEKSGKISWTWVVLSFFIGSALFHFGSSGELFYFPAIFIVLLLILVKKKSFKAVIPNLKTFLISGLAFLITILPQIAFNFKHDGILWKNIQSLIFSDKTFGATGAMFLYNRLFEILGYLHSLLFHAPYEKEFLWLIALTVVILCYFREMIKNEYFKILFIFLASGVLGLLFFRGNFGNVYGYYLTGYYLIFLLFVGTSLAFVFKKSIYGKVFVTAFLIFFLSHNWFWTKGMLNTQIDSEVIIVLGNQKQALDYIYQSAGDKDFNVDVYVPPVIPHAYDYLFTWYGSQKYGREPLDKNVPLLYTLYEVDPEHPDRLKSWLKRQASIGKVTKEARFGGIIVQERVRLSE